MTSDEPENEPGDGNTCYDAIITGPSTVQLRAERNGDGDGRVYTIFFNVADTSGNTTEARCKVEVRHDHDPAVDSGPAFCTGQGCGIILQHDPFACGRDKRP